MNKYFIVYEIGGDPFGRQIRDQIVYEKRITSKKDIQIIEKRRGEELEKDLRIVNWKPFEDKEEDKELMYIKMTIVLEKIKKRCGHGLVSGKAIIDMIKDLEK